MPPSSGEVTVPITVNPVNDQPTAAASPASLTLNEDASTTVDLSASDVETAAANLTFTVTAAPAHGMLFLGTTVHGNLHSFPTRRSSDLYAPDANYNGADSFKFKAT